MLKIVSFCFPIVGLVLYFVWKNEKPKSASDVCKFAAIGFGVGIVLYILMMALGLMAAGPAATPSGRASNTVGRPCGSACVVTRPLGL